MSQCRLNICNKFFFNRLYKLFEELFTIPEGVLLVNEFDIRKFDLVKIKKTGSNDFSNYTANLTLGSKAEEMIFDYTVTGEEERVRHLTPVCKIIDQFIRDPDSVEAGLHQFGKLSFVKHSTTSGIFHIYTPIENKLHKLTIMYSAVCNYNMRDSEDISPITALHLAPTCTFKEEFKIIGHTEFTAPQFGFDDIIKYIDDPYM